MVSGPSSDEIPVRLTGSAVVEVIRASRTSLLVVSFAAFGVSEVVRELVRAAERGVRADLVLEDTAEDGGTLRGGVAASAPFEALRPPATFWRWTDRPGAAARCPRCTRRWSPRTRGPRWSAARTSPTALTRNLEVGVILRDPDVVRRLAGHFRALTRPRNGSLRPRSMP
ncbi:hypothetical protein GCM10017673_06070 [Streptosporangium violaceochromogenes]|nr:hypothetical protein GCM10017673_06070 [Streptosporangium violaceochromogenes]